MSSRSTESGSRRTLLLDAAVDVLAESGIRGLTHRAVDRQADLPQGSCSAYLRTRRALQVATAEHVTEELSREVSALAARIGQASDPTVERDVVALFARWVKNPRLVRARLELTLEGLRDADIARTLAHGRGQVVAVVINGLQWSDDPDCHRRAEILVSAMDGLMLGALPLPPRRRTAYLDEGVRLLFEVVAGQ